MSLEPQTTPAAPVNSDGDGAIEQPTTTVFPKPWGIFSAAFLLDLAQGCVGLSLQFLAVAMGAVPRILGMLGAFGSTGYAITCIFAGGWSDRIGRKRSAAIGMVLVATMWLLYTLAPTPTWLLLMVPIGGGALGLIWPAMQAWLAERTSPNQRALNRNLGLFNVAWSSGLVLGPIAAGYLWLDSLPARPFIVCASIGVCVLLILLRTPGGGPALRRDMASGKDQALHESHAWERLMKLSWVGNFGSWFAGATILTMFPKLGIDELGFSHPTVGILIFCYQGALTAMFFLARTTQRWQGKLWPLPVAEWVSLCAMLFAALYARSAPAFGVCFALSGAAAGVTYVSSLYYSINGPSETIGRRTGLHESILGIGALAGGLISGDIAMRMGLRTPYIAVAIVLALVILFQLVVVSRHPRGDVHSLENR
ncbi:MAG: MFS transporter [candidate division WS1 bacterium]|nr:MFS transporter [candidate division WS1 bacterium]